MSATKHGPKLRAKILTASTRYFRERELVLVTAGFRWIFHKDQAQPVTNSGKLERPGGVRGIGLSVSSSGKKVIFPIMGREEFDNLKSHGRIISTTALIGALREATTIDVEGVVGCKHGSTPASLREQLGAGAGGRVVTVNPRPGETSRETFRRWQEKKMSLVAGSNHGADAMRYAYSGTDWAKNMAPKAYQLTAREHRDSIDFYEISKELTRNNPIAFVQGGKEISYGGFVVIHGHIIRQAGRKVAGEDDVDLQHMMPGGFLGGMGVPFRFKDAWVFECQSGKEFALWKKWIKLVRSSRWDHTPAHTFTVTFPEA